MANSYPGAVKVGASFASQYYHVLKQKPDLVYQFYDGSSSVIRVDGESVEKASEIMHIHELITSLNFTGIEIKTINSLDSLSGGVLVVVSGSVKAKEFAGRRNFVQTFLLAPQEKGFFVLNDVFHLGEEVVQQPLAPMSQENVVDYQHSAPTYSENRVEASEHFNSVHIEGGGPVDEYNHYDQQPEEPVVEYEYVKAAPEEDFLSASQYVVNQQQESSPVVAEEPIVEPRKFTYASILQASTGKPAPSITVNAYPKKTPAPVTEWDSPPQSDSQQSNFVSSYLPDSSAEVAEDAFSQEGESKSVYVKNLPPTVTTFDIQQEFENFGRIKPDGVFIKNRKEVGVCFAFVEFEDVESVQNAVKASPLQLVGRQIYIEERRPSSNSSSTMSRGGRRGRGRGSYQNDVRGRFGGRSYGRGNSGRGSY
ncbi:hypothetical protein DCAR_0521192 [Daucus carota subsp. sativus]|uniref:NTF2 domain-containing protein n=1 Tax=Daucus carota subsp. sativus TaxID=79200 RepID=A0AAF1B2R3_DAUCS|nr:hypothetical protein DCAR_0521192 [Daucus carota subsp. sativus]